MKFENIENPARFIKELHITNTAGTPNRTVGLEYVGYMPETNILVAKSKENGEVKLFELNANVHVFIEWDEKAILKEMTKNNNGRMKFAGVQTFTGLQKKFEDDLTQSWLRVVEKGMQSVDKQNELYKLSLAIYNLKRDYQSLSDTKLWTEIERLLKLTKNYIVSQTSTPRYTGYVSVDWFLSVVRKANGGRPLKDIVPKLMVDAFKEELIPCERNGFVIESNDCIVSLFKDARYVSDYAILEEDYQDFVETFLWNNNLLKVNKSFEELTCNLRGENADIEAIIEVFVEAYALTNMKTEEEILSDVNKEKLCQKLGALFTSVKKDFEYKGVVYDHPSEIAKLIYSFRKIDEVEEWSQAYIQYLLDVNLARYKGEKLLVANKFDTRWDDFTSFLVKKGFLGRNAKKISPIYWDWEHNNELDDTEPNEWFLTNDEFDKIAGEYELDAYMKMKN